MSLRILCDHCVPMEVVRLLRDAGHDVMTVREVMPPRSPDVEVIKRAGEMGRVLVSLDGDFADVVAYPPDRHGGIIALQLHNHPEVIPSLLRRLCDYLSVDRGEGHYVGKLFLVEAHRIRIRSGPTSPP